MKKLLSAALLAAVLADAPAATNTFFTGAQPMTTLSSNVNAVTIQSGDYRFTYSADGYWSAYAGGPPTGRFFSIYWPTGVQAQAITAGPLLGQGANLTIQRADGKPFDLGAFTGKLLAYTAGTGAAFEVMPLLNGEDALNDPLMFDASGSGGQSFRHTPNLVGYDTYKFHLFVDWALTALTLVDTNSVAPSTPSPWLEIELTPTKTVLLSWPTNSPGFGLQHNPDLAPLNWATVTDIPAINGTNYQINISPQSAAGFFRLQRP